MKRARPRLCAVCHLPATHALDETRTATHIDRYGNVTRFPLTTATYYCGAHIPKDAA